MGNKRNLADQKDLFNAIGITPTGEPVSSVNDVYAANQNRLKEQATKNDTASIPEGNYTSPASVSKDNASNQGKTDDGSQPTPASDSSTVPNAKKTSAKVKKESSSAKTVSGYHEELLDVYDLIDAPDDWNRYDPMPDKELVDLSLSIMRSGLINPITVWEQQDGRYMILSGHNRRRAIKKIIEVYGREKEDGEYIQDKYRFIPCMVYPHKELNESKAKSIIIDANENTKKKRSKEERLWALQSMMNTLASQKDAKGHTVEEVCKSLQLEKSQVYALVKIASLPPELRILYTEGKLSSKNAEKLAMLPDRQIKHIASKVKSLECENIKRLESRKEYTDEQLDELLFKTKPDRNVTVVFKAVPRSIASEYRRRCTELLNEMTGRVK